MRDDVKKAGDVLRAALKARTIPPGPFGGGGIGLSEYDIAQIVLDVQKADYDALLKIALEMRAALVEIEDLASSWAEWEGWLDEPVLRGLSASATIVASTTQNEEPHE